MSIATGVVQCLIFCPIDFVGCLGYMAGVGYGMCLSAAILFAIGYAFVWLWNILWPVMCANPVITFCVVTVAIVVFVVAWKTSLAEAYRMERARREAENDAAEKERQRQHYEARKPFIPLERELDAITKNSESLTIEECRRFFEVEKQLKKLKWSWFDSKSFIALKQSVTDTSIGFALGQV